MNCNSAVWAVLLCVSAHQHRVPFLGIQPSNVPTIGSSEHMESRTVMVPANGMVNKLREELKNDGALLSGLIFLAYLDIGGEHFCLLHPLFAFMCASYFCLVLAVMPWKSMVQQVILLIFSHSAICNAWTAGPTWLFVTLTEYMKCWASHFYIIGLNSHV